MKRLLSILIFASTSAMAQTMTLDRYLDQVKAQNPDARSAAATVASYELRTSEAETGLFTELYGSFNRLDDKKPTAQPIFMGSETKSEVWRAGIRKQTQYGLGADLYFNAQRTNVLGASTSFMPLNNYMESSAVLELKQSLWRNGFGESTRADVAAKRAGNDQILLKSKFRAKNDFVKRAKCLLVARELQSNREVAARECRPRPQAA